MTEYIYLLDTPGKDDLEINTIREENDDKALKKIRGKAQHRGRRLVAIYAITREIKVPQ